MKNIKISLILLILISTCFTIQGQDIIKPKKNIISFELGGSCRSYSINFMRNVYAKNKNSIIVGVGTGYYFPIGFTSKWYVPIKVGYKYGNKLSIFTNLGILNIINFTPYPKTKVERDSWRPDGGLWIEYPFYIRPCLEVGTSIELLNNLYLNLAFTPYIRVYKQYPEVPYRPIKIEAWGQTGLSFKY